LLVFRDLGRGRPGGEEVAVEGGFEDFIVWMAFDVRIVGRIEVDSDMLMRMV
jgi:hypothetical protein